MQKSFRSTLILAGLLLVAVLWYTIYEGKVKPKRTEAEENTKKFVLLERDQIQEIDLERLKNPPPEPGTPAASMPANQAAPEYEKFKLRKTGNDWNIAEPIQTPADSATVSTMISTLTTTKEERTVDEKPSNLDQYGLKNPVVRIVVRKDAASPALEVDVGTNTPTGFSSYVKVAGRDAVFRASRTMRTAFDKPLKDLRDKSVVNVTRFEIGEAEIQAPKLDLLMKKDDKDNWTLARDNMPADNNEWNKTLNAIVDLKATDFVSEDPAQEKAFGLNPPLVKITLTRSKDKSRVALWLGKVKDKVYARRQDKPTIYEVDKNVLDKVEKPAASYRNMQLAIFNRFDITRVKLERGKDGIELVKDNGNWSMPTEPGTKLDNGKVEQLLTTLQDTKITQFTKSKLTQPELTIRIFEKQLKDKSEAEKLSLRFGRPKGNEVAVERSGVSLPFAIKVDDFKKIDLGKDAFIAKEQKKAEKAPPAKKG